jgi:hypothetical protein
VQGLPPFCGLFSCDVSRQLNGLRRAGANLRQIEAEGMGLSWACFRLATRCCRFTMRSDNAYE